MEFVIQVVAAGGISAGVLYALGVRKVTGWTVLLWIALTVGAFLLIAWLSSIVRELFAPLLSQ